MKRIALLLAITVLLLPSLIALGPPAMAQNTPRRAADPIQQFNDKLKTDLGQAKATVTGQPAPPSSAALPCMDISVITKLTVYNLVPTFMGCEQDAVKQLVSDTSRALDSAQDYQNIEGGVPSGAKGDNDGIHCLSPALALFKAAVIVPAVPSSPAVEAQAAIMNPDGTVKTPAVTAAPAVAGHDELKPGPVLLSQKFREFTLAGGLTSCQSWFNGPIQAVAAAGVGGLTTAVAGAALIVPKP